MALAFGAALGTKAASGVSTTNFATTGSVASGGLIVAGVGLYKNGTVTSVTVSGGSLTWQTDKFVTPYATDANYTVALASAYAPVGLASSTTLTLTLNGGGTAFAVTFGAVYFTGSDSITWLDVANTGAGVNGSQHWTSNITTTNAADAVVGYGWIDLSAGSDTPDTAGGWVEALDFQNTIDSNTAAMVYRLVSSTGTYSPNGTFTGGGPYVTVAAAYKEAAAGTAAGGPFIRTFNAIPFIGGAL